MMLLDWLGPGCALISAACIALLAAVDPRRRGALPARAGLRGLLAFAALLPGIALAVTGRWTDFLIWIGAAGIFGWAIAVLANLRAEPRP
jgi:hypothetical protein